MVRSGRVPPGARGTGRPVEGVGRPAEIASIAQASRSAQPSAVRPVAGGPGGIPRRAPGGPRPPATARPARIAADFGSEREPDLWVGFLTPVALKLSSRLTSRRTIRCDIASLTNASLLPGAHIVSAPVTM